MSQYYNHSNKNEDVKEKYVKELKEMAKKYSIPIILPKAPPIRRDNCYSDLRNEVIFIDYLNILKYNKVTI